MIAAIVLAAGTSSRFGAPKMLAPLAGRPLVRWTVERVLASSVDEVAVVVGPEADAVRGALAGLPVRCVVNARYTEGQSTSLQVGLAALDGAARAAVIALGDQPSVDAAVIDALIARHRDTHQPIVAPRYQGVRGNPVLFDASVFAELDGVRGDRGARDVIAREPARVAWVELDVPMPRGVEVPGDLEALERCWPPHGSMRPV